MSKRILLISYNYHPEMTGIGKYNTELCAHLQAQGNTVKVITGFPYYPNWKLFDGYGNSIFTKESIDGVSVIRCPIYIPAEPSGSKRMLMDCSFYFSSLLVVLYQLLSFKKYDIVIAPSPSFMSGFHNILMGLFWRKTVFVYHIQDLQIDAALELGIIQQDWLKKLLLGMEKVILNRATVVSTISQGMRNRVLAKSDKLNEVVLFSNWVDDSKIFKQPADLSVIANLGIPLNKKVFFYSGAIGEKQGLEIIIDIAPALAVSSPSLLFVISGSGPYKLKLQESIAQKGITNILFIELQPTDVFNHLLNYVDCHLIIQKKQAADLLLPSKLTNILAVGGLCIVTAAPGTSLYETVHINQLGIVIAPENAGALQSSIESIYSEL